MQLLLTICPLLVLFGVAAYAQGGSLPSARPSDTDGEDEEAFL